MRNDYITLGDVENVYARQIVTLSAGEVKQIPGVHTFLRIYTTTGNIEIAAQNTGIFQPITAGTWIKNPVDDEGRLIRLPYIRLKNTESFSVTVDLALSNGEVGDDAFLGTASVDNQENAPLYVQDARPTDYKVTVLNIPANDSAAFTPDPSSLEYLIQNQGSDYVVLFGAAGIVVQPDASFTANLQKSFPIVNPSASAAVVTVTEFLK